MNSIDIPYETFSMHETVICNTVLNYTPNLRPGNKDDAWEFYLKCMSLSGCIESVIKKGRIPEVARDLPEFVKLICSKKTNEYLQEAVRAMMKSIKIACEKGWFQTKESEELVALADEIMRKANNSGSANVVPKKEIKEEIKQEIKKEIKMEK